jgi:hypothetical protein
MAKVTMKSKILDFVESQGAARFTDIQRFIVDHNKGEGTYDAARRSSTTWGTKVVTPPACEFSESEIAANGGKVPKMYESVVVRTNPYRGYYSVNLSVGGQGGFGYNKTGYIMVGAERLEKGKDGLYRTIRG